MENNTFELLLNDLYDKYNPGSKKEIPNIIKKYIGQELDAVYLFLVKYNYSKHPNYDSSLNDINSVKKLLLEYNSGNRILIKQSESAPSIEETIKEKVENKINHTTEHLNESLQKALAQLEEKFFKNQQSQEGNIEIKLNILYTDSEIQIPKEIGDFSIGTRFLVKDSSGKLIALEVKSVFCDFVTLESGFIKEITIDVI